MQEFFLSDTARRVAGSFLRKHQWAEKDDVFQEAAIADWEARELCQGELFGDDLEGRVGITVQRALVDYARKHGPVTRRGNNRLTRISSFDTVYGLVAQGAASIEDEAQQLPRSLWHWDDPDSHLEAEEILKEIPHRVRVAAFCYAYLGWSDVRTAEYMGISVGRLWRLLGRARDRESARRGSSRSSSALRSDSQLARLRRASTSGSKLSERIERSLSKLSEPRI